LIVFAVNSSAQDTDGFTVVRPVEYSGALRNPLKGFRANVNRGDADVSSSFNHEYATLVHDYIKWNDIEDKSIDGVQKIKDHCNERWKDVEKHGIKVIPRVILEWEKDDDDPGSYWPSDIEEKDRNFTSEVFKTRVAALINKLGQAWDDDPRVAWVQSGFVGVFGEQNNPFPDNDVQKVIGDAFSSAFSQKKWTVRNPSTHFEGYYVGAYWDSWAHHHQVCQEKNGAGLSRMNRWKDQPIEGETSYDWPDGSHKIQPGDDPDDTINDPLHRNYLLHTIRALHCSALGWVAAYTGAASNEGKDLIQRALGYRFVVTEFQSPKRVEPGEIFTVKLKVKNTGSAPLLEDWKLRLFLLEPSGSFAGPLDLDQRSVSEWMPGEEWDPVNKRYDKPAEIYEQSLSMEIPIDIRRGEYLVAVGVVNPAKEDDRVLHFAIKNHLRGGFHPFCNVGVGVDVRGDYQLEPESFYDPRDDRLPYSLPED